MLRLQVSQVVMARLLPRPTRLRGVLSLVLSLAVSQSALPLLGDALAQPADPAQPAPPAQPAAEDPAAQAKAAAEAKARADAEQASDQGKQAYRDKEYAEAYRHFERAHSLAPDPKYLYNMARCQEKLSKYTEAVALLEKYLSA